MFKIILMYMLSVGFAYANVLALGDTSHKFKCDNEIKQPISLLSCKTIVAIDTVNICYMNDSDLGCVKLFKGDTYNIDKIKTNTISFKRLIAFNENESTSFGVKRFSNELKDIGLPAGTILKPNEDIFIPLNKEYQIELTLFDENNRLLMKNNQLKTEIHIPKKFFLNERSYKLFVKVNQQEYNSNFDILDKESENSVNKEISNIIKQVNDKKSQNVLKSIIYDQYGLNYNRNLVLKGVL
ncbi:MAG: hypothetical protein WCY75_05915 [Sulfurimonadaceae bacterium]